MTNKIDSIAAEAARKLKDTGKGIAVISGKWGAPGYVCLVAKSEKPDNEIYQWMVDGQVVREYNSRTGRSKVPTSPIDNDLVGYQA